MGLFLHTAPYRAAQVTEPGPPLTKSKDMEYRGRAGGRARGARSPGAGELSEVTGGRGEERWPVGLRAGQENGARQPGTAKSGSERAGARLRARGTERTASVWPEGHSGWRERGERPEEACAPPSSWGRVHPNADPRKRGGPERGARQARRRRRRRLPEQEQERQSPCRKEQRRGGAGKLPPGAAGPAAGVSAPALGASSLWPAGRRGPSSLLLHSASLAQRPAGPGPPAAPSAGGLRRS